MYSWLQPLADFDRAIKPLPVVKADNGVNLRALVNLTDDKGVARLAGDEWQLRGPLTYSPRADVVSVWGCMCGGACVGVHVWVWECMCGGACVGVHVCMCHLITNTCTLYYSL